MPIQMKAAKSKKAAEPKKKGLPSTVCVVGEFNGSPTCNIYDKDKYESADTDDEKRAAWIVGFGLKKARAICRHADEIQEFVDDNA